MVRQMRRGKRKTKRYRMRHAISDRGACISVPDSQASPILRTSPIFSCCYWRKTVHRGGDRRVIWRKPHQRGVKFETRIDERVRAVLVSAVTKEAEPAETDS